MINMCNALFVPLFSKIHIKMTNLIKTEERKRIWWDKVGWQGLSLFAVALTALILVMFQKNEVNPELVFLCGFTLAMFILGEK